MGKHDEILARLLSGTADAHIAFANVLALLAAEGFTLSQRSGSHVIATKTGVGERITLQADGSKAKGYQVRQLRNIFLNHPELLS